MGSSLCGSDKGEEGRNGIEDNDVIDIFEILHGSKSGNGRGDDGTISSPATDEDIRLSLDNLQKRITLYHYTTKEGRKGIEDSGIIYESRRDSEKDDARFGDGVYLTSLPPTNGKSRLALNNYGGSVKNARSWSDEGRVDNYVAIDLCLSDVEKVPSDRDVYRYYGDLEFNEGMNPRFGSVIKT